MKNIAPLLTRDALRIFKDARKIARSFQQPVIHTDVLLLSLLLFKNARAEEVWKALKIRPHNISSRITATIKLERDRPAPPAGPEWNGINLSVETYEVLQHARLETEEQGLDYIDPRVLVLGMLRLPESSAGEYLRQFGITPGDYRTHARLHAQGPENAPEFEFGNLTEKLKNFPISPTFIGLLILMAVSGYFSYAGIGSPRLTVMVFVISGWIVSVALHEFGHALIAYWGGDKSVADKGYLTLDPLKYTNPLLSILLPVVFLLMGGIGLPGGAVYINTHMLKNDRFRSMTSAAGPIATALCALLIVLPFALGWISIQSLFTHFDFWSGVAFLGFLEITALFINLLPIPGLDGFGIIEPFLPPDLAGRLNFLRPYGFLLLFVLIFIDSPISSAFWMQIWEFVFTLSPEMGTLAAEALSFFQLFG